MQREKTNKTWRSVYRCVVVLVHGGWICDYETSRLLTIACVTKYKYNVADTDGDALQLEK